MFVPFIFELSPDIEAKYLCEFYRCLSLAKTHKWPIIASEEYFNNPDYFVQRGRREAFDEQWASICEYELPEQTALDLIMQCKIPKQIIDDLIHEKKSISDAAIFLFQSRYEKLEVWLLDTIDKIQSRFAEQIEAIITFRQYPSLTYVTEVKGINVIYYDMGTFRAGAYRQTAYIDFFGFYNNTSIRQRYEAFLNYRDKISFDILSRKEILSIFLAPIYMKYIQLIDSQPEYEMGVAAQSTFFCYNIARSNINNLDLIVNAKSHFRDDQLLLRHSPGDNCNSKYDRFISNVDHSEVPFMFICKCKRVLSLASNMAFEAMLWNRCAYELGEGVYTFKSKRNLSDKNIEIVEDEFVNFVAFCFYIPYEFLINIDYLRWRLTNPSEIEIYHYHLNYYLSCRGIDEETLNLPIEERLFRFLEQQGFDANGHQLKSLSVNEATISILKKIDVLSQTDTQKRYLLHLTRVYMVRINELEAGINYHIAHDQELELKLKMTEDSLQWHINELKSTHESVQWHQNKLKETEESLQWHVNHLKLTEESLQWHKNKLKETEESLQWHVNHLKLTEESLQWHKNELNVTKESLEWHVNHLNLAQESLQWNMNELNQTQENMHKVKSKIFELADIIKHLQLNEVELTHLSSVKASEYEQRINNLENDIEKLKIEKTEQEEEIMKMKNSLSWRLTKIFRKK